MFKIITALASLAAAILIVINAKMKIDIVEKELHRANEEDPNKWSNIQ